MDMIVDFLNNIVEFIQNAGLIGAFFSCLIITIESMFPIIPLLVFITINFLVLGNALGFITSWVFTILGCILSYEIFKKGLGSKFEHLTENKQLIKKYTKMFKNISTGKLLLIVAFPFTPAFMVNIAAGLSKMDFKKYIVAILFGKISLVFYSAYIGKSFIESITNPIALLKAIAAILVVYLLYILAKKVFKLNI